MDRKAIAFGVIGAVIGGGVAFVAQHVGGATVRDTKDAALPTATSDEDDSDEMTANARLVDSLQECNRRLSTLGQKTVEQQPTASATERRDAGRARGDRGRSGPLVAADWEKHAADGTVPYSIPCVRDTPVKLTDRQIDRLGLAPQDARVLDGAYAASNQRVASQLGPLCARVVGKENADRIGTSACMSAIIDSARRENPQKMRDALVRVDEVNAGKRPAPPADSAEPVEALMLALTNEAKQFEADLAAQLGPDEARRLASSRGLCSDRGTVRATQDAPAR